MKGCAKMGGNGFLSSLTEVNGLIHLRQASESDSSSVHASAAPRNFDLSAAALTTLRPRDDGSPAQLID